MPAAAVVAAGLTAAAVVATPVPQRCVLVLPSTGEFDSRAYRIASTLAGRGHTVTIVARTGPGLAQDETHPAGYRILRVDVSWMDGLPGPLRQLIRASRRRSAVAAPREGDGETASTTGHGQPRRVGRVRRGLDAIWRLIDIGLTVRSQRIATERVAPGADLIHAMAYMGIPVGLALGRKDRAPVIYDARDIYLEAANLARLPGPVRRVFGWIERRWARRASRVVTVNEAYAAVMADRFGVPTPLVVMNCSYRRPAADTRPWLLHDRLGLDRAIPLVLYHGGLTRDRGIEQLIAALPEMPGVALVLLGYGSMRAELDARAADPALAGRLFVLDAVAPTELHDWVASADVVALPIQPTTLNHRLTTPNKLFEAMAAGVPVVAGDLPGMAAIVRETGCGVLVDPTDPVAIAAAIRGVLALSSADRAAMGRRGLDAHLDRYNWEAQATVLLGEYGRLTGRSW
jgi:glycosyltransferase involved in cell wall biosynthesis